MTPRLTFHGAARAVTGSCFRLETGSGQLLIDCGMFQGSKTEKELNYRPFPFRPVDIATVILSHAHIDHSGLLPKLVKDGFSGPIHATAATADLASVMLPDSAHIQAIEVEQLNRRKARWSKEPVEPIYSGADADTCLALFRPEAYDRWFGVLPGVRARFWNAGHLLGSASIEIEGQAQTGRCGCCSPATSAPISSCCIPIPRHRAISTMSSARRRTGTPTGPRQPTRPAARHCATRSGPRSIRTARC
jgi:metallo-beta-lactamase family protein